MRDRPSSPDALLEAAPPDTAADGARAASLPVPELRAPAFVTATHAILFATGTAARCEICGDPLREEDDVGAQVAGSGMYLTHRGEAVSHEEAPLCHACATVINVTALQRVELEEDDS